MTMSMAIQSLRKSLLRRAAYLGNPPSLSSFPRFSELAVSAGPRPIVASSATLKWRAGERRCRRGGGFCFGNPEHNNALGSCFYSKGGPAPSSYDGGGYLGLTDEELMKQCEMGTFKASGPGGQHRNKRESAVRLKHVPTGIIAQVSELGSISFVVVLNWHELLIFKMPFLVWIIY